MPYSWLKCLCLPTQSEKAQLDHQLKKLSESLEKQSQEIKKTIDLLEKLSAIYENGYGVIIRKDGIRKEVRVRYKELERTVTVGWADERKPINLTDNKGNMEVPDEQLNPHIFFVKPKESNLPWLEISIKGESLKQAAERSAKLISFHPNWHKNNFTIQFSRDVPHVIFEVDVYVELTVRAEVARRV